MFTQSWKFPVCVWRMLKYNDIWEKLCQTKRGSASTVALLKKRLKTVLNITDLQGNDPLQFS